ncbi:MAG TPA: cupin domain-containing protein [Blastocatellia bacterium]|nr:cupin domain-containing protein [Blastocatellia bacterium]
MRSDEVNQEEVQELAALYALGALSQREARAFESRLTAGDTAAEAELHAFESVVASLSLAALEAEPPAGAKNKLFARLAAESAPDAQEPETSPAHNEIFHVRASEGEWVPYAKGILMKLLSEDREGNSLTFLLKMAPGSRVVRHFHHGVEECYVLEGDFHIGDEDYGPGDFQCALPGSIHEEVYTNHGAMVLITAPARFEPIH